MLKAAFLGILILAVQPARAQGFLGGGAAGLDPRFCEARAIRQTVVYVDDMVMQDGQTDWAVKLYNKLKATLVPGERLSVVELQPARGISNEVWSGCWPNYSEAERTRLGQQTSFFSANPLKALDRQQTFFGIAFSGALSTIYDAHKRREVQIDAADPPRKAILAALASDEGRYTHSDVTVRAIVYSDLAENSELGSVYKPLPNPMPSLGKRLGTSLVGSVFYGFGLGRGVAMSETVGETTRAFWTAALGSMNAAIGGLGSDLNGVNAMPVEARAYQVELHEDGQELTGRLSLLVDAEGGLVDSWLQVSRLSTAALSGTMRCQGKAGAACAVAATTSHGIISDSRAETVTLRGDAAGPLSGHIGVRGSEVMFPLSAQAGAGN